MIGEVDFWRDQALRQMSEAIKERERRKADRIRYRSAILALLSWAKENGKYKEALSVLKSHE